MNDIRKVAIIIPIYHPDEKFCELLKMLHVQKDVSFDLYIFDSGSKRELYEKYLKGLTYAIIDVDPRHFNHGGTRQEAAERCHQYPYLIYMTQDAIPANENSLRCLLEAFSDNKVGCAYGRQLPHKDANILAARARLFNYPPESCIKQLSDVEKLGIKVSFISNTFAAYRQNALASVGGFPINVILGEDTYVASKMILSGWKVAYCAEAQVYHSHNYSLMQEFRRYFDTGVFHSQESWIKKKFGHAESEGIRLVINEMKYLLSYDPSSLPNSIIRNAVKFLGYRLGLKENVMPHRLKLKFSMSKNYWIKR